MDHAVAGLSVPAPTTRGAHVLASSKERCGVPLQEEAFPLVQRDWIDDQQDLIRKAVLQRCFRALPR
jgi:hypothetical protein